MPLVCHRRCRNPQLIYHYFCVVCCVIDYVSNTIYYHVLPCGITCLILLPYSHLPLISAPISKQYTCIFTDRNVVWYDDINCGNCPLLSAQAWPEASPVYRTQVCALPRNSVQVSMDRSHGMAWPLMLSEHLKM